MLGADSANGTLPNTMTNATSTTPNRILAFFITDNFDLKKLVNLSTNKHPHHLSGRKTCIAKAMKMLYLWLVKAKKKKRYRARINMLKNVKIYMVVFIF